MWEYLQTPVAQAVIWVSLTLIFSLVGFYVMRKARDQADSNDIVTDHLTNFRELLARGVLDDGEFRTIKTSLANKLRDDGNQARDQPGQWVARDQLGLHRQQVGLQDRFGKLATGWLCGLW
jgi:hypothetical protein